MAKSSLDLVFSALAHPTRRAMLTRLARREASVGELAAPFRVSLPAMSRHLGVLEGAGLVTRHVEGRVHHLQLVARPMKEAADWIHHYERFWSAQFDSLSRYLEGSRDKTARRSKPHREEP